MTGSAELVRAMNTWGSEVQRLTGINPDEELAEATDDWLVFEGVDLDAVHELAGEYGDHALVLLREALDDADDDEDADERLACVAAGVFLHGFQIAWVAQRDRAKEA